MPDPRPRRFVKGPHSLAIDAINADGLLTVEEKRDLIKKVRGQAFGDLDWGGEKIFPLADGYSITVRAATYDAATGVFSITDASATHNGVVLDLITPRFLNDDALLPSSPLPFRYVNPPLMVYKGIKKVQGVDHDEFIEDVPNALKEIVTDTLRLFG